MLISVKNNFHTTHIYFEYVVAIIHCARYSFIIIGLYTSPKTNSTVCVAFVKCIEDLKFKYPDPVNIICGDFNLPKIQPWC